MALVWQAEPVVAKVVVIMPSKWMGVVWTTARGSMKRPSPFIDVMGIASGRHENIKGRTIQDIKTL